MPRPAARLLLACMGAFLASISPAQAQLSGWYVSGSLGGYFRQDETLGERFHREDAPDADVAGTERLHFDPSALIGTVALGRRFGRHFRLEGELGYDRHHVDALDIATSAPGFPELDGQRFERQLGDDYTRFTGEVNGFYDIVTIAGRFTPYVGAGVGGSANHQSAGLFAAADGAPFDSAGGSSTEGFAVAEGGLAIALTPQLSLVPAYRYVHYFSGGEDVANVAKLGLRFSF